MEEDSKRRGSKAMLQTAMSSAVIVLGVTASVLSAAAAMSLQLDAATLAAVEEVWKKKKKRKRKKSKFYARLNWPQFISDHGNRYYFPRHLRMTLSSFEKLVEFLRKDLTKDEYMSSLRGGVVIPELQVYVTLRFLADASHHELFMRNGISMATFYRILWKVCEAIVSHPSLSYSFPQSFEECADLASGFESISFKGAIDNCVGAVDGFFVRTITPSKKEAKNVRSFFSGHYKAYGMNCQAVCDHYCRFIYFGVVAPGVTNDRDALAQSSLDGLIEGLPPPFCVIGDAAYTPTEHLVPVYYGDDLKREKYDNFSFYASQLRIRIEMAFGILTQKWGVLQRPLRVKMVKVKLLMLTLARLHSYVINERLARVPAGAGIGYSSAHVRMEAFPEVERNAQAAVESRRGQSQPGSTLGEDSMEGFSVRRELMANRVASTGLKRPAANRIIRRKEN